MLLSYKKSHDFGDVKRYKRLSDEEKLKRLRESRKPETLQGYWRERLQPWFRLRISQKNGCRVYGLI